MLDTQLAQKVRRGFDIHTTFSISALAAPTFAAAATRSQINYSFYMGKKLLNSAHINVGSGSKLSDFTTGQIETTLDLSVIVLERNDVLDFHLESVVHVKPADCLAVLASRYALARLNELARTLH